MKQLIISVFSLLVISTSCTRDQIISDGTITTRVTACETVRVTQQGLGCDLWGIDISGHVYPAFNLPEPLKKEGNVICVTYELVEDKRNCPSPCCGGIWANITSIQQ